MRSAIPRKLREKVKAKFGGRCGYCGIIPPKLQIDHLIPVARAHMHRGLDVNSIENLMPVCHPCNNYKLVFDLETFRAQIQNQVGMCRQYSVNFRNAERYGLVAAVDKPIVFYFEQAKESDHE
jgi:hypothetical protein